MKELRKYLIINSLFSGLSGFLMLIASDWLNNIFHISNPYVFPLIGVNLLVFSLFVWYVSVKLLHQKLLIKIISLLDGLWVLGSFAIVAFQLFGISLQGYIAIAAVAVWVGYLGLKQTQYNN